jgi:predicted transcriptional regulator of viral defense system
MQSYSTTDIILTLKQRGISLFTLSDFERIFSITNKNTLSKKIKYLEHKKVIRRLINGKFSLSISHVSDFKIAQFILSPSYISLESALSFHGIITGFSYDITSITPKLAKKYIINEKEFTYSHIDSQLFWGYEKREDFLIATKEKAFLDYSYLSLKGIKASLDFEEIDTNALDKALLLEYAHRWGESRLLKIIKRL